MTIYVGSCGGGGTSLDRFAPKYLVGNTANGDTASVAGLAPGFQYFPDPGDGSASRLRLQPHSLLLGTFRFVLVLTICNLVGLRVPW